MDGLSGFPGLSQDIDGRIELNNWEFIFRLGVRYFAWSLVFWMCVEQSRVLSIRVGIE